MHMSHSSKAQCMSHSRTQCLSHWVSRHQVYLSLLVAGTVGALQQHLQELIQREAERIRWGWGRWLADVGQVAGLA